MKDLEMKNVKPYEPIPTPIKRRVETAFKKAIDASGRFPKAIHIDKGKSFSDSDHEACQRLGVTVIKTRPHSAGTRAMDNLPMIIE